MPLPFEQQPRESNKAFAAFKTYLDLGPDRSFSQVAAKRGVSPRMVAKWSSKHGWCARVAARDAHLAELERQALERLACAKAVEWWQLHEPVRRQAWQEAEEAIAQVREARQRWRDEGRIPGFEGMARMLELAFKLKQFAAGMPGEIKEVHSHVTGKISVEWQEAIRKAYAVTAESGAQKAEAVVDVEAVGPEAGGPRAEVGRQKLEVKP